MIKSSLLYILFVLPFNVTFQLPLAVEIFNTNFEIANPFVSGIYVNYLIPTLSIMDLGIFLLLISILIEKGSSIYLKLFKNIKNGIVLFLLYLVVQNIFIGNPLSILNSVRFFSYLLVPFLVTDVLKKENMKKIGSPILVVFLFNTVVQGVIAILQFRGGSSLGLSYLGESRLISGMQGSSFLELGGELFLRGYGTFPHPNVLGGFLLLGIIVGIFFFKEKKVLSISLILLSMVFLLFTFSRVSIFLGIISILIFIFCEYLKKGKSKFFSFSPILFLERFKNVFTGGDSGLSDRSILFESSMKVVKKEWFTGLGLGNYVRAMEDFVPRTGKGIPLLQPVHNIFILIIAELGIIGFLLYIYILFQIVISSLNKWSYIKSIVLIFILTNGVWDHYLVSLPQGLGIFILLLLSLLV
jgi:O-antigen ligase